MEKDIHNLVQSIFDESVALDDMVEDGNQTEITDNKLNRANFDKKEFQELWNQINHKYAYTVHYDSNELIKKVVDDLNANLSVKHLSYTVQSGEQKSSAISEQTKKLLRKRSMLQRCRKPATIWSAILQRGQRLHAKQSSPYCKEYCQQNLRCLRTIPKNSSARW
ncbi:hypothetical protein [Hallerella porci]|uniref:hypothetical protein n=1 Tax=Hallerella porci TaxID=1945871 RepID=UPI000D6BAA2F|nr:hypothetical protein [Hallerella porci]